MLQANNKTREKKGKRDAKENETPCLEEVPALLSLKLFFSHSFEFKGMSAH